MAYIAIHAGAFLAMTIDAPAHGMLDFSLNPVRLGHLTMTVGAIDLGAYVRFMIEENICFGIDPVDSRPRRLFLTLGKGS